MQFLKKSLNSTQEFNKDLILDAFQTRAGKLDTKKIMYLLKYEDKIKDLENEISKLEKELDKILAANPKQSVESVIKQALKSL